MTTIARKEINEQLNGVEIYFSTFPIKATRDNLKANGFKWNPKKSCWYAKRSEATEVLANICADTSIEEYEQFAKENNEETKKVNPVTKKTNKEKKINSE